MIQMKLPSAQSRPIRIDPDVSVSQLIIAW